MMVCIECHGLGQKQDLSFILDIYGNQPAHNNSPQMPASVKNVVCPGCGGSGKYNSFSSSGSF
jgi:hypothetical protein